MKRILHTSPSMLRGLKKIINFTPETMDVFFKLLGNIVDEYENDSFLDEFCQKINCTKEEFGEFLETSIRFYKYIDTYINTLGKDTISFFKESVESSLRKSDIEEFTPEEKEKTLIFLEKIYSMDTSLGIIAKANFLSDDVSNSIYEIKTLTDIRHIFYKNIDLPSNHVIIRHILKISYLNEEKDLVNKEFSVKSETLKEFKKVIDRALNKEKTLILDYTKKGIKIIKEFNPNVL